MPITCGSLLGFVATAAFAGLATGTQATNTVNVYSYHQPHPVLQMIIDAREPDLPALHSQGHR